MKGRVIRQPQGKVLGGSSAINAEVFIPAAKAGVDAWAKLGNSGWDWETLRPYYRRFHTLNAPDKDLAEHLDLHWLPEPSQGPVQASFQGMVQDPLSHAWTRTFQQLGHALTNDPFSGSTSGAFSNPISVDPVTKARSYAANAYFLPASSRPNLSVVTGALVHRILLEKQDDEVVATGVRVQLANGSIHDVTATKEVILAAGALQSPKILELSGIGNASLLSSLGITPVIDNPGVGENLQDHLMTGISYEVNEGVMTGDPLLRQEPEMVQAVTQMYQEHRTGPLCSGGLGSYALVAVPESSELGNVLDSKDGDVDGDYEKYKDQHAVLRDIYTLPREPSGSVFMFAAQVNLHSPAADFTQELLPGNFLSLGISLLLPFSRGSVHITSADPSVPPRIDPRYFSHPADVEVMARQLLFMQKVAETQPLASFIKKDGRRNHESVFQVKDVESAKEYVRTTALSNNHPACSCPMLPRGQGGVVDERLRVYGARRLRVVDSSVLPLIPRGTIQTSVYAVAERAADLIKEDAGL